VFTLTSPESRGLGAVAERDIDRFETAVTLDSTLLLTDADSQQGTCKATV